MQWSPVQLGGEGEYRSIFGNALFRNLGEGKFREVSDLVGDGS